MLVTRARRPGIVAHFPTCVRQVHDIPHATLVRTDVEGDAIAELPRIGDLVDTVRARGAVLLRLVQRAHTGIAEAAFMVRERHRPAEGEAAPLDERARDVGRLGAVLILQVHRRERAQRAVSRLRACVD
jgi:hypothetical protein